MYLSRSLGQLPDLSYDVSQDWPPINTGLEARRYLEIRDGRQAFLNFRTRLRNLLAVPYTLTVASVQAKINAVFALIDELGKWTITRPGGLYGYLELGPMDVVRVTKGFDPAMLWLQKELEVARGKGQTAEEQAREQARGYAIGWPERGQTVPADTGGAFSLADWLKPPKLYYVGAAIALVLMMGRK